MNQEDKVLKQINFKFNTTCSNQQHVYTGLMTTPPSPSHSNQRTSFPLFERLLKEAEGSLRNSNPLPTCPQTAPIILDVNHNSRKSDTNSKRSSIRNTVSVVDRHSVTVTMDARDAIKEQDKMSNLINISQDDSQIGSIKPLTLKDPPKCKLKRQLSKDTADQLDSQRVHKKFNTGFQPDKCISGAPISEWRRTDTRGIRSDEVDGDIQSQIDRAVAERTTASTKDHHASSSSINDALLLKPDYTDYPSIRRSPLNPHNPSASELSYYQRDSQIINKPPQSPNHFNLDDIGLTSPFTTSRTPGVSSAEKNVFVFPDSVSPRKVSPYKIPSESLVTFPSEVAVDHTKSYQHSYLEPRVPIQMQQMYQREVPQPTSYSYHERRRTISREECDLEDDTNESMQNTYRQPTHVTSEGFKWPTTASISEPVIFSPKVVNARPQFPSASPQIEQHRTYDVEYEKAMAELQRLKDAKARAERIYGIVPDNMAYSQKMSPRSREIADIKRSRPQWSISNIETSPNDKTLREARETIKQTYRSISNPNCSPRHMRDILQQQSPLARSSQHAEIARQENQSPERRRDSWQNDVRRRLFMKADFDDFRQPEHYQPLHTPDPTVTQGSTDIPEEVLQFLHTRNFHPEDLDHLKDLFQRSKTTTNERYQRSMSMQYDLGNEEHQRMHSGAYQMMNRNQDTLDYMQGPIRSRERQIGDIDVRVNVESITEKARKQGEILHDLAHESSECKCSRIEEQIRLMASDAWSKTRRTDQSSMSHDQFQKEVTETNAILYNSMSLLCGMKSLCKNGRKVEEIYSGSVVFRINCPNFDALEDLWTTYKRDDLQKQLQDAFVCEELLEHFQCTNITLKVTISWEEYCQCKRELENSLHTQFKPSLNRFIGITPIHTRSRSEPASVSNQANQLGIHKPAMSPFRERFSSDSSVECSPRRASERRAFREINVDASSVPHSATRKFIYDNVFVSDQSPRSPGRKTTNNKHQQENIAQFGSTLLSPRRVGSSVTSPRQTSSPITSPRQTGSPGQRGSPYGSPRHRSVLEQIDLRVTDV